MEDLVRYLNEIIEPTVKDFEEHPTSVRHAFLACIAVFHAVDYRAYPKPSAGLRQQYRTLSPEFALVDKLAHAFKHVITGKREKPDLKAAEVIPRTPMAYGVSGAYGLSRYGDFVGGVTLDKERTVGLLDVLKGAVEFLRKQMRDQT